MDMQALWTFTLVEASCSPTGRLSHSLGSLLLPHLGSVSPRKTPLLCRLDHVDAQQVGVASKGNPWPEGDAGRGSGFPWAQDGGMRQRKP